MVCLLISPFLKEIQENQARGLKLKQMWFEMMITKAVIEKTECIT